MVVENRLVEFIKFLFLRADSHAQYEIRVYAEAMLDTVKNGCDNSCCIFGLQSRSDSRQQKEKK